MSLFLNMIRNSFNFFLIIMLFVKCNTTLSNKNDFFIKQKNTFGKETILKNLNNHFPKKIKNINYKLIGSYPSLCTKNNSAQYGNLYLIVNKADYKENLLKIKKDKFIYKTYYNQENIIIDFSEFKHDIFSVQKCNNWYDSKFAIPYFESYDFGIGESVTKKEENGTILYKYTYTIPNDLQVYVIQAKSGIFWKKPCNEKRPKSLKEWRHGYSKGIAVSDKEDLIVFWSMIW